MARRRRQGRTVVEVEGLRQLTRRLRRIEGGIADLKQVHKTTAEIVATATRVGVPVRSGKLLATVRAAGTARMSVVRAGTARVPYAAPIHWGWPDRHIAPNTFMLNAAFATEPRWTEQFDRDIAALIERTGLDQ